MKPTYEELEHQLEKTEKLLKRALNHIIELEGRIAKLEEQLKLNSKNRSPPLQPTKKPIQKSLHPKKPNHASLPPLANKKKGRRKQRVGKNLLDRLTDRYKVTVNSS